MPRRYRRRLQLDVFAFRTTRDTGKKIRAAADQEQVPVGWYLRRLVERAVVSFGDHPDEPTAKHTATAAAHD